jgi:hypothetical protein
MKIIQFIHPSPEHTCRTGSNWNIGNHRRKYLELAGKYLTALDTNPLASDKLYFWGEWEAQSHCRRINHPVPDGPHFIFNPYYQLPLPANAANTDPFVFGDQFYYCICKQAHYSSLRNLNSGDIILFGSCIGRQFVLDTVFVIKNKSSYLLRKLSSFRKGVNQIFSDVSLGPIERLNRIEKKEILEQGNLCVPLACDDASDYCASLKDDEYFVYEAVMYEDRELFNGMFSYAPCLSDEKGSLGFARPIIDDHIYITPTLNQGLKISEVDSAYDFWHNLTDHLTKSGLELMIDNSL